MQVIQGAKELEIANREMFSTTKGVSSISDGLLNARIGIVELLIDSDNDIEETDVIRMKSVLLGESSI